MATLQSALGGHWCQKKRHVNAVHLPLQPTAMQRCIKQPVVPAGRHQRGGRCAPVLPYLVIGPATPPLAAAAAAPPLAQAEVVQLPGRGGEPQQGVQLRVA